MNATNLHPPLGRPRAAVPREAAVATAGPRTPLRGRLLLALLPVAAIFALPLYRLVVFALGSELYSYVLLVPVVSAYAAWLQRDQLPAPKLDAPVGAALLAASGLVMAFDAGLRSLGPVIPPEDALALTTLAFLLAAAGMVTWLHGRAFLRSLLFPAGFLLLMVPVPSALVQWVETGMQHGSAFVAHVLFQVWGTPVFFHKLYLQLPGVTLHVAPECSGIRSTLVLAILSIVTARFFLRSFSSRTLLLAAIVPLALVRNGFRIFVLGELCVRYGPAVLDSALHRRGGPLFFALSLVPLLLFAWLLHRRDLAAMNRSRPVAAPAAAT